MKKFYVWIFIVITFICQMSVIVLSGSRYCNDNLCGTYFWGAHEHDGVWHLAIVNSALKDWSGVFPTYSGETLNGYNTLLDYFLKFASQITSVNPSFWYFKILPILWFVVTVWIWKRFALAYDKRISYFLSLLFFIFWGNSFSYFFRLFHENAIWGASGILAMQSPQMLNNVQFALTLPLFALFLITLSQNKKDIKSGILIGITIFLIMGLKFYGGVIAASMLAYYLITTILRKRYFEFLAISIPGLFGLLISVLWFYNPLESLQGPPILTWSPLTTVRPILEELGLLYLPWLANLRNNLIASGNYLSLRLLIIEIFTIAVFIFFNWGTRIVSLLKRNFNSIDKIIAVGIITGLLMNILFIQRGEWWNTVQFLYYALFLTNIWAAKVLADFWNGNLYGKSLAIIVILLTLPNGIDTMRTFTSFPPQSYISDNEAAALKVLSSLKSGVVLALPIDPISTNNRTRPLPLYNMYDTAYVAAYSGQQTYLNDLVQLRLTGIDYIERLINVKSYNCATLEDIDYIYVSGDFNQILGWEKCHNYKLKLEYDDDITRIYSVITDTPNQY